MLNCHAETAQETKGKTEQLSNCQNIKHMNLTASNVQISLFIHQFLHRGISKGAIYTPSDHVPVSQQASAHLRKRSWGMSVWVAHQAWMAHRPSYYWLGPCKDMEWHPKLPPSKYPDGSSSEQRKDRLCIWSNSASTRRCRCTQGYVFLASSHSNNAEPSCKAKFPPQTPSFVSPPLTMRRYCRVSLSPPCFDHFFGPVLGADEAGLLAFEALRSSPRPARGQASDAKRTILLLGSHGNDWWCGSGTLWCLRILGRSWRTRKASWLWKLQQE